MKQKVFTATEARQNFFDILKLVDGGISAVIEKKDVKRRYILTIEPPKRTKNIKRILNSWDKINLDLGNKSWKEIKKIISTRYDLR